MKTIDIVLTALIPSVFMGLSANFLHLSGDFQNLLESFTTGLLIISGASLLTDFDNNKKMGVLGFVFAILFLQILSMTNKENAILPSLYFDSLSDGLLLGTMLSSFGSLKSVLLILVPMTFEMAITASTSVSMIGNNISEARLGVTMAGVILGCSILLGTYIGSYINKTFVTGIGAASMLWLGLKEFMPKLNSSIKSKNEKTRNVISLFLGILSGVFLE